MIGDRFKRELWSQTRVKSEAGVMDMDVPGALSLSLLITAMTILRYNNKNEQGIASANSI